MTRPLLGLALLLLAGQAASGQGTTAPVVAGVYPPGAMVGQTVEWSLTGRNLAKIQKLSISGGGVEVLDLSVKDATSAMARVRVAADASPGYREVRVDGQDGLSNLSLVRLHTRPPPLEVAPNDDPARAQEVAAGSAVVGVLAALDLDHFKIRGTPGSRLTLDLEARRIGTSIAPVVTVFGPSGASLAQGRESSGEDRDCRMGVTLPAEGWLVVQVRDNTYAGNDQARYRLRVDPVPYATAIFPLGGPRGRPVEVEVSGGNLPTPIHKSITLPDAPGSFVEVGEVDGPGGPVRAPGRLLVGDGPELTEPSDLRSGVAVNGRLAREGEVDSYRLAARAGEKVRLRVDAAAMGSWLDSVVVVRDEKGAVLAENDDTSDAVRPAQARSVSALGVPEASPDSAVEFEAKADGVLTVEVSDRFGAGGPEYGYRLEVGASRPDFAITLLLGNANMNLGAMGNVGQARAVRTSSGQFGVFNLKPGATVPINFLIAPVGRPGRVEVRVEGLPDGVEADPVDVRVDGPRRPGLSATGPENASPVADSLILKVGPHAQPGLSWFRVVATARPMPGVVLTREAGATIGLDLAAASNRPITRVLSMLPLRIVGEARPRFVGPPAPPTLRKVTVPGPLLLGDRLDLGLDFSRTITPDDGSILEAKAGGIGLAANTVISAGTSIVDGEAAAEAVVRVLASPKAKAGKYPVLVSYTPPNGPTVRREVIVEVRAPVEVRPAAGAIFLRPGDSATFKVEIRREAGFEGEVDLRFEGLPRGVKLARPASFAPGTTTAEVALEMAATARPLAKDSELRVIGIARIAGGNVPIDSQIRPMIRPRPAEK